MERLRCIYYTKNNELYYFIDSNVSKPIFLEDNVSSFIIQSEDEVYYKDLSGTLWYKKGTEEPRWIADNVSFEGLAYDGTIMFIADYSNNSGKLYYSRKGREKTLIGENVSSVSFSGGAIYYCANFWEETNSLGTLCRCDLYYITENMHSKLLLENISCNEDGKVF